MSDQGLTQIEANKKQHGIVEEYVKNIVRESQLLKKEFSDLSWPIVLFLMIVCVIPLGTTLNQSDLINIVSGVLGRNVARNDFCIKQIASPRV